MNQNNNLRGFIQIPLLIAIIVSGLVIGVASYVGIKKYQGYQFEKNEKEKIAQEIQQQKDLEVEKLMQEVDGLKKQQSLSKLSAPLNISQINTSKIIKESPVLKIENDITSIIKQWRPRVAFIDCRVVSSNVEIGRQSGSGYILGADTKNRDLIVLTNNHVIDIVLHNLYGKSIGFTMTPTSCNIKIPDDSQFTTVYNVDKNSSDIIFAGYKDKDFGTVNIKNPTQYMKQVIETNSGVICNKKAELGEKILILGYPAIGDQNDITVTDGIISGYDGDYYITSAKVESGNSGGVAVSLKNNCYLGIPTFVQVGSIESLARVLDIQTIFQ